jgi:serine/threonine-protein kinase HipA
MRKGAVTVYDQLAGWLIQDELGYRFVYDRDYIALPYARPVSLTMPLQEAAYTSATLFPFFDGLIPEGWLLEIAEQNWKLNPRDRMGLLLACCKDCIGAVGIEEVLEEQTP